MMDPIVVLLLVIAVLCLAAATAALTSSVPFLFWKSFRLDAKMAEELAKLQIQIDTLDEALARLLEGVGVPPQEPR